MHFLDNITVRAKIMLLALTMLVFLILIGASSIKNIRALNMEINELYHIDLAGIEHVKEANVALVSASRALRNGFIAYAADDERAIVTRRQMYDAFMKTTIDLLQEAEASATEAATKALAGKTRAAVVAAGDAEEAVWGNIVDKTPFAEIARNITQARAQVDAADNLLSELGAALDAEAATRLTEASELYTRSFYVAVISVSLSLILGFTLTIMIRRAIADPLKAVAGKAELVARGNLDQNFSTSRRDEIGDLSGSLEKMVENLRNRIAEAEQKSKEAAEQSRKAMLFTEEAHQAREEAEEGQKALLRTAENVDAVVMRLSSAITQLSAQIEHSSRSADEQRDRVTSSATAMEEMNATVLEVARNAAVAADRSTGAKEKAQNGSNIVKQSIEAMSVVRNGTARLREEMTKLTEQADSIGTIMTVIRDIADQTNLLALNAAIEAARAGEAGRGFAVVADEVRKLAEKTMNATKEVGDAIEGIQSGTQRSMDAVADTVNNLEGANRLADESNEALQQIVEEVEHTADQVRGIAAAAEEQSASSEEINSALEQINRLADATAHTMHESAEAVNEISGQTSQLQNLVAELREA